MVASGTRTESMAAAAAARRHSRGGGAKVLGAPAPPRQPLKAHRGGARTVGVARRRLPIGCTGRTSAIREPRGTADPQPPGTSRDSPGTPLGPPGPRTGLEAPAGAPPPRDRAAAPARLGGRGARGTRLSGNRSGLNKATRLEAAPERERIPPPLNRFRGSGQVVLQMRLVQMPGNAPGCERSAGLRPFRYVYLGGGLRVLEFRQICGRVGNNRAA